VKFTNKHNLPRPFVDFEEATKYSKGDADFSVTQLLNPPQINALYEAHEDELTEDVSDNIMRLLGTAVHLLLEKADDEAYAGIDKPDRPVLTEERMVVEVDGKTLSGGLDRMLKLDPTLPWGVTKCGLQDYKVTSAATVMHNPEGKTEWVEQTNMYGYIGRKNGYNFTRLWIIAILRDWKLSESKYKASYPKHSVKTIEIPVWDDDQCEQFIRNRIKKHTETPVPLCTDEDRWMSPPVFAAHKYLAGGALAKKATKLFKTRYDAETYALDNSFQGEIMERISEPKRCADWCDVSQFCNQYKEQQEGGSK
jgi:hypothetical protein